MRVDSCIGDIVERADSVPAHFQIPRADSLAIAGSWIAERRTEDEEEPLAGDEFEGDRCFDGIGSFLLYKASWRASRIL